MNDEYLEGITAKLDEPAIQPPTTIGIYLHGSKRKYTYQCARPVYPGDRVNVKLPGGAIVTEEVIDVHDTPQLSDKWETKWAVVVQSKAEYEAEKATQRNVASDLGQELGL